MNVSLINTRMTLVQKIVTSVIMVFGLLTLFMSSAVIFDLFDIRDKEGNYVLFIVWTNFISGLLYLFVVWGLLKQYSWTTNVLALISLILIISFVALFVYINKGGIYETKTAYAMLFRIVVTLIFTLFSWNFNNKKQLKNSI